MKESLSYLLLVCIVVPTYSQTTEYPHQTVTYNPGQDCLPYDGSVVPDCSRYIDPVTKQPYYHEHSANCSRFWECGPSGETCLFECAPCGGPSNAQCQDQWALTFDTRYQFPDGPVCDWPGNVECMTGCPEGSECCENSDCNKCPDGFCNLDWTCTYPGNCDCSSDADCANSDGVCNVPAPHSPDNCAYCDNGECAGGCADLGSNSNNCPTTHPTCGASHMCGCSNSDECAMYDGVCDMMDPADPYTGHCYYCDADQAQCVPGCGGLGSNNNCPDNYECNLTNHQCELSVCDDSSFCAGFDQICNDNYDNCFFCGAGCGAVDGCCPGCHDDDLNCAYPQPVCNQATHTCGCENDNDCNVGDFCNTDTNTCEPTCADHPECAGFDETCNDNYDNCFFCGGSCGASDGCCPGCHDDDLNCAYPKPICNQNSNTCGCQDDNDCNVTDFCNTDTNSCEPVPNECETDADCNDGLTGVCEVGVAEQTQCKYCTHVGHRNVCKPGCQYDSSSSDIPRCPSAAPVCNKETHICQANSGSILLTKMVFTSRGCEGCNKEGVNMTLTGTFLQSPKPQCKTVDLDYPNRVDYTDTATFLSIPTEEDYGWRNCWNGPLDGLVSEAVVVWTGDGQWSPDNICYDWDKGTQVVSVCSFPVGTTLAYGQSATGSCETGGTSCP